MCHSLRWCFSSHTFILFIYSFIATIDCGISSPSLLYLCKSFKAILHWLFIFGEYETPTELQPSSYVNTVVITWMDPWRTTNFWAISSHVYNQSEFCNTAIFSMFSPLVTEASLPDRCFLLISFHPLWNSFTYLVIALYPTTRSGLTSFKAFTISCMFFPTWLHLNICQLFFMHQCEHSVCYNVM